MELVKGGPRVLLDGAQNGASAKALSQAVRRAFKYGKLVLVLGVSKDKDVRAILRELVPLSDAIVLTKAAIAERAMEPSDIASLITAGKRPVAVARTVAEALDKARSIASPRDLVLVAGSLFVVGEARAALVKDVKSET
jgi:dihydrofolate synthase/folylpolyglutamate synthase